MRPSPNRSYAAPIRGANFSPHPNSIAVSRSLNAGIFSLFESDAEVERQIARRPLILHVEVGDVALRLAERAEVVDFVIAVGACAGSHARHAALERLSPPHADAAAGIPLVDVVEFRRMPAPTFSVW